MATIAASQLRARSIESLMEDHLTASNHAVISVKGQPKFVIVSKERYAELTGNIEQEVESAKPEKIIIETQPSLITKIRDKFFS